MFSKSILEDILYMSSKPSQTPSIVHEKARREIKLFIGCVCISTRVAITVWSVGQWTARQQTITGHYLVIYQHYYCMSRLFTFSGMLNEWVKFNTITDGDLIRHFNGFTGFPQYILSWGWLTRDPNWFKSFEYKSALIKNEFWKLEVNYSIYIYIS